MSTRAPHKSALRLTGPALVLALSLGPAACTGGESKPSLSEAMANAALVRRGRWINSTFVFGIGDEDYLITIREGRIDSVVLDTAQLRRHAARSGDHLELLRTARASDVTPRAGAVSSASPRESR